MNRHRSRAEAVERTLEVPMIIVSLLVVPVLFVEMTADNPLMQRAAFIANIVIWVTFVLEYGIMMWLVPDRWRYTREHWLDLAIIILSPPLLVPEAMAGFRALRSLRIFRLLRSARGLRVLRALRFGRLFAFAARALQGANRVAARHSFNYVVLVSLILLLSAGTLFFMVEGGQTIQGLGDGIWWAITTMTTVGYGDIAPVTMPGRILAVAVMLLGIGFMAALTANIAAWFVERDQQDTGELMMQEIRALRQEVAELRALAEVASGWREVAADDSERKDSGP